MSDRTPTPVPLAIYRDLRVGMVIITLMVFVAILIEELSATCWQFALSAYYYTSAHSILIAALLALGVLLILYRGTNDTEDAFLTLAGVSALMIAMVPQGRPELLCGQGDLPSQFEPAIRPNVWTVVLALIAGWLWTAWLHYRNHTRHARSPLGIVALCIFWLIMALGAIALVFFPAWFNAHIHGIAGVLMLSSFIVTVFGAAYVVGHEDEAKSPHRRRYQWCYRGIAGAMVVTLIAVIALHLIHPRWQLWVLLMESLVILEFAAYWAVQTFELWKTPDRRARLPDEAQQRLEEQRATGGGFAGMRAELSRARSESSDARLLPLL
ncbi:hypothetical protein [Mycobacterium sp. 94-17]|uniref:hypothetical protein n=1 Tax=Mycobacterium sp. 94-17 TaxID=2986147 RepID=UPI002D1F70DF|nr:hypothetical protein [Mycobacterium sp. 94-17]MEB4207572.1 hypothetical protein [Mycobacterium sp. 94-17]